MDIFQVLASIASIISIPLAIYFARKNNNTTSEKARLDIIQTLSYRLSDTTHTLTKEDIDSVYKSKLREHEIIHAKFNQEDILNDLKTNIMSNAFLSNDVKNNILYNLSLISFINNETSFSLPIKRIVKLFISPVPYILLIMHIIICVILLYPIIIHILIHCIRYNELTNEDVYYLLENILYSLYSYIAFAILLVLSVINFCRKKYINKHFKH